ncbi:MAG: hypothetical protein IT380_02475 [Myxococcales bacterium]|nr:hypothetical protein [Myxococcales bacterium]
MNPLRPLERLAAESPPLTFDAADAFVAAPGWGLLVLSGDAAQRPEAQDLAVVAQELKGRAPQGSRVGVVTDADEARVKAYFQVPALPALLVLRDGKVLSRIPKLQEWAVYSRAADVLWGARRTAPAPEVTP